jgi:hypothetical protein
MTIIRPEFRCPDCEGTDATLYVSPRNTGGTVQIVHACEHLVRDWYPDAPAALEAAHADPVPPHLDDSLVYVVTTDDATGEEWADYYKKPV